MGVIRTKNGHRVYYHSGDRDTATVMGGPGPGKSLKRKPSFKENSPEPDMQRVVLKQAQSTGLKTTTRKPSMPKMPWDE